MTILFCQPTLERSGSEMSLLEILEALRQKGGTKFIVLAGKDGPLAGRFERLAERLLLIDAPKLSRRAASWPRYVRSFWTTCRSVRTIKRDAGPRAVYVNTSMFPQAVVAAFLNRLSCVVHIHEVETTYPRLYYRWCVLLAALLARRIIVVSRFILCQRGLPLRARIEKKASVIYNSSAYDPGPRRQAVGADVTLLAVTPIAPRKGVEDLVRLAEELKRRLDRRGLRLKIVGRVGDPHLYRRLQNDVERARLSDTVRFCGEQTDLRPFYTEADVLVHPSRSEAFPRVLVEAANFSLPAVTTDAGGSREAVADGVSGFVVPIGDVQGMADRIVELIENPSLYAEISAGAAERFHKEFSRDVMVERLTHALDYLA